MPLKEEDKKDFQRALARLQAIRCALTVYKGDHDGSFPSKLENLIPKYLSQIPEVKLPGHEQTNNVVNIETSGGEERLLSGDTGGWAYFTSSGTSSYGKVVLDCQHVVRYKKLCEY